MRWIWVLIAIGILIVGAFVAVGVIVSRYDYNSLKPVVAEAVEEETGRELTLAGDIGLDFGLTPSLYVEGVSFENAPWGSRPEMASVKRFEVQVALLPLLKKDIRVKRLVLIEPDILIETDSLGMSNLDFGAKAEKEEPPERGPARGEMKLPELTLNKMRLEKGRLTYKDGKSGKSYVVTLDTLDANARSSTSPVNIDLAGSYNDTPYRIEGTIGPFARLTDPNESWSLDLKVTSLGATAGVEGAIRDAMKGKGIELNVNAQGESLPRIANAAGVTDVPELGRFDISMKLTDPTAKTYNVSDLRIMLGGSDVAGSVEANMAGERPRLTATLTSHTIDLRPVLPEEQKAGSESPKPTGPKEKKDKVFSDEPLPIDMLNRFDAQAKLRVERVLMPRIALNDLNVDIVLDDGNLIADPIKAIAGGGPLDGHVHLRGRGNEADLNVAMKADQVDLGRMLKELDITDLIDGNLDADIELVGRGVSVASLMADLGGKTVIVMGNGKINNKYVDLIGTDLSTNALQLFNPFGEKKDYTELNCFVSRFDVNQGVADSTALVVDTSRMSIIGDGRIDLGTEKLDISLKPSPKEGVGIEQMGKVGMSLGELVKPFKLGGTLARPRLAIDPTQSIITVGKAVGGVSMFGAAGIAAALATTSEGDGNPCLAALVAAETGVKPADIKKESGVGDIVPPGTEELTETVGESAKEVSEGAKEAVGEATKTFKGLFGGKGE